MDQGVDTKAKITRGEVISTVNDKTAVVSVTRIKTHRLYHKKFQLHKKIKVHDELNECSVGDMVEIVSCRPVSAAKRFKIHKIIK